MMIYEREVPERALSLKSTNYPDQGHNGDRPLRGKIPTAGPGIEPGTSCLVVRSSDHQAMGLMVYMHVCMYVDGCTCMYIIFIIIIILLLSLALQPSAGFNLCHEIS
jgi:hypothetical protein